MISLTYGGKVEYITRIEDFRDFMEPGVYDAMVIALEGGIIEKYKDKYEVLKSEYEELESEYNDLSDVEDELRDCERELGDMTEKYEELQKALKVLITQTYQGYIKQEDVVYVLERLI